MDSDRFSYLPFSTTTEIRTIIVVPENTDDPSIRCTLRVTDLDKAAAILRPQAIPTHLMFCQATLFQVMLPYHMFGETSVNQKQ